MTPKEEYELFLKRCKKEKIQPTPELFATWQEQVRMRQIQIEAIMQSDNYKNAQKEKMRRQQRTVEQTINEDGAIISPITEEAYVTKREWEDHKKAHDVIEVGNETVEKRKKEKQLKLNNDSAIINQNYQKVVNVGN